MAEYKSSNKPMSEYGQLAGYFKPRIYKMFHAEKLHHFNHGTSVHLQYIVELYFNAMSPTKQQQLLDEYEKSNQKNLNL